MDFFEHGGQPGILNDFSCNVNPLGLPKGVAQILKNEWLKNQCYPDPNCLALRTQLAQEWGDDPGFVICGNGASELIYAVVRAVMPHTGIVTAPAFSEYERALLSCGAKVVCYTLKREYDFQPQEDFFPFLMQQKDGSMLFLCNPNNPIGNLLENQYLLRVLEVCAKKGIFVVVDECFLPFAAEDTNFSLKNHFHKYDHLFLVQAFTKLYAMPGLRLGYGISCNKELLKRIKLMMPTWNVSMMAQLTGIAAWQDQAYVKQTRSLLQVEQHFMKKELNALENVVKKVYPPGANFIFWEGQCGIDRRLAEDGIAIRNCKNYRGLKEGDYRVAIKSHTDNQLLLQKLKTLNSHS
jgi:threonine-phosphate decarboxylase